MTSSIDGEPPASLGDERPEDGEEGREVVEDLDEDDVVRLSYGKKGSSRNSGRM